MRSFFSRALSGTALTASVLALGATGAAAEESYTVRAGDTLISIAGEFDVVPSWEHLAVANDDVIDDPDLIRVGQELLIDEAATPEVDAAVESAEPDAAPEPAAAADAAPEPADGAVAVSTWDRLAECESNQNWSINTGNGYYGGVQFSQRSWEWVGGSGMPHQATKAEQIARAEILLDRQGWVAWPACSKAIGLR